MSVTATDVDRSAAFYQRLGLRLAHRLPEAAILEMRGGTHLIVSEGEPSSAPVFDFMVDDLDGTHAAWTGEGLEPGPIQQGKNHRWFIVTDPSGADVRVNDSHVVGVV